LFGKASVDFATDAFLFFNTLSGFKMKNVLITLFLFQAAVFCQNKMNFEFDYAQFAYDSTSNFIEFYYAFNLGSLSFVHTDSADFAKGFLHINVTDSSNGESVIDKNWLISNTINDSSDLNKSVIGLLKFVLDEGSYKCEMTGQAASENNSKTITEYITIKPFANLEMGLSDIQLASNILQDSPNSSSPFYKNTFEVTPAPSAIFGEPQPVLFYYTELYSLLDTTTNSDLRMDQIIYNSRGIVVDSKSKKINRSINSRVEVGTVKTYQLPTDTYTIMLNLIDSVSNYGISSTKKFFVYNPNVVANDSLYRQQTSTITSNFGVMSAEELDDLFTKCKFIATKTEVDQYESLSGEQGKREFMQKFWDSRDQNQNDNMNKFYQDYLKRIKESNQKFRAGKKEGWKTDRGRVYLVYGEPSEIERYPNETQARPYEIWHYNDIEGGAIFVFGDLTGFSDYQLLHSTKRGELRDDNWTRRIAVQ
jgi:GWxTD domain-containing protein